MSHNTPQPPAPAAQRPRSSNTVFIVIGAVAGCGCLLLIGLAVAIQAGIIGGLLYFQAEEDRPAQVAPQAPVSPQPAPPAPTRELPQPQVVPGREAALDWATRHGEGWVAEVDDYSEDWAWVRLLMGPPQSEWVSWLEIEWDASAGGYRLLDEGPMGYDGGDASVQGPGPTEAGAVQAALDSIEQPTWVTRIQERSDDWRRVTLWAGPPQSEWVYAITVEWDDDTHGYVVQQTSGLPYP